MCKKDSNYKYFLKSNGKEIKEGEEITLSRKEMTPFGVFKIQVTMPFYEEGADVLIDKGVIERRENKEDDIPMNEGFYINRLERKHLGTIFHILCEKYPSLAFQMLLKEIALYMEQNDGEPLSSYDKVYAISTINGKIVEIPKEKIHNYSTFAAFSSRENAEKAKKILKILHDRLYGDSKKKYKDC